ncbi:hypothetical protein ACP4OV_029060 [Aristida adscensionis]
MLSERSSGPAPRPPTSPAYPSPALRRGHPRARRHRGGRRGTAQAGRGGGLAAVIDAGVSIS